MEALVKRLLPLLLALRLPAVVQAQFNYTTNNGTITITGYTGPGGAVAIPSTINGLPVASIGPEAFAYDISVTSVSMGSNVTSLGSYAFYGSTSLTSVSIPNSVTDIGNHAFEDCSLLTAITVDALNLSYSSVAGVLFDKGQTTLIQYPGGKAGAYTIPYGAANVGSYAFYGCSGLTSVVIPNGVKSIGSFAFYACDTLTGVAIPNSATNIGSYSFAGCKNLTAITVSSLNPAYSSVAGVLFDQSQTTLIQYPSGKAGSYVIPNGTSTLGAGAFNSCASLTGITIPNSVTSIGDWAFGGCTSLASITIPNSVTTLGSYVFDACTRLNGVYFKGNAPSIGLSVFYGDNNATVYYLPGTTGWGPTFAGLTTVLWNPQVQTSGGSFGVRTNRFGFTITGASNLVIVVEACTNLANPGWSPVGTNSLNGGFSYFSDPQWSNYPGRFYRLRSQ